MSNTTLNILNSAVHDEIVRVDYHPHLPYSWTTYNINDEFKISK